MLSIAECGNMTTGYGHFELLPFLYPKDLKFLLLLSFFLLYILCLSGNGLILLVVVQDPQLHKPMYQFLCHLAIMDMIVSSVVVPNVLAWLIVGNSLISFAGCVAQLFFSHALGCAECFLYTVMAFDRFLAICKPLHYGTIMNHWVCFYLSIGTWVGGCLHSIIHTWLSFLMPYGRRNRVNYIFCDIPPLMKIACADTSFNELFTLVDVGLVAMTCFLLILTSYVYIISAILKIPTSKGRHRAFSTCTAHITLVVIYYVPVAYSYLRPPSQASLDGSIGMFYTAVTPCLNPLIYTLRNKEMKMGIRTLCFRKP